MRGRLYSLAGRYLGVWAMWLLCDLRVHNVIEWATRDHEPVTRYCGWCGDRLGIVKVLET